MASNRGKRFGSLMTSFKSPTSTGKSIDLREERGIPAFLLEVLHSFVLVL